MILDEPTAALDGDTRRQMWTILKRMRTGRTVLLSTHYMDEAEFLADRIAIMVDGRIYCCGSPAFLKKAFGAGYHLELETTAMADVQRVTDLVLAYVPSATPNTDDDSRLRFNLPETSTASFKDLLAAIEDDKEKLGVLNYHMVAMTMEEVFIRVGQMVESKDLFVNSTNGQNSPSLASGFVNTEAKLTRSANPSMVGGDFEADGDGSGSIEPRRLTYDEVVGVSRGDRNTGCTLLVQQFGATLLKRVLYCRRKWPLFAIQLALPLGFIVLVSLATLIVPFAGRRANSAALPLILDEYAESSKVVYGATTQDSSTTSSLARVFASFFDGGPHELMHVADDDSVKRVLLRKAAEGYSLYRTRYLVAAEFRIETVNSTYNKPSNLTNASSPTGGDTFVVARALYNHEAYHTAAVALNVIDNVLLRHLVGGDNYTIETMNHPIDGADDMLTKVPVMKETFTGLLVSVVLLFGMSFYTSTFVLFLIQERKVGCLRCEIISGLRFGVYWLATFLWDLVVLYAFFASLLILLVVLKVQCLIGDGQLWLLFLAFSWAVLPFLYVASLLFTRPSTGVARLSMLNVFVGFAAQGFWTLQSKETEVTQASLFNSKVVVCTVLHPIFALLSGLNIFCHNWSLSFTTGISDDSPCSLDVNQDMCSMFKHQTNYVSLGDAGIGWIVLLLTVQGVIFLLVLRWRGSRLLPLPWGKWLGCLLPQEPVLAQRRMTSRTRMFADDVDVEMERWRIGSKIHSPQQEVVVVHDLTRYYGHQMAINGITFGVPAGQCFGLLGVNGAGKTTTLRLIAGDLLASHGTVFVNGHDVRIDVKSAYERLAYCPQGDPLLDFLTGRETLSFFARLSGIPEGRIPSSVNQLILSLQLTKMADMPVMTYSMGEKRCLSAGLAFVTEPAVILIDEPSVGLDPAARRRLGKLMANFNKCGGTTVLASNCMNECEQLCQRVGMLVGGRLRCLGSPSHLRDKFGQGYTVTIKLKRTDYNPDSDQLKTYLDGHLLAATITGESDEELQYHVTNKAITWPALYVIMEEARESHDNIVDYVISQATLQHVFLGLARLQETQDDSHMSMAASSVLGGM